MTHNIVASNSSGDGGGMCIDSGIASDNTFIGNSSSGPGGGIKANNSTISNNVVQNNNAVDGGGIYSANSNLISNMISGNNASGKGGGIYANENTKASENKISDNTAAEGGGIYAYGYAAGINLSANTIQENAANAGGGIYAVEATLRGNTVISNTAQNDGGGIYADSGTVTDNTVSGNTVPSFGHGSGVYLKNVTDFSNNIVTENTAPSGTAGGVSIDGQPQVLYNNLYDNQPYDAEIVSTMVVTATLNYWGQSLCTDIPDQIYDGNDAPPRGKLLYAPSLYSPAPVVQMTVPANLILTTDANAVTLNWTPVPTIPDIGCRVPGANVPDLGYRVYYDNDGCAPFDGKGLLQGSSPVDVGTSHTITLNGLSSKGYFFTVTAYDYLTRESSYSNSVHRSSTTEGLYLPFVVR